MGKRLDVALTILCLATMAFLPILRSGELPQIWERIIQFDLTGLGLRGVFGWLVLGVQMIPALWFACFARHYVTNMLIFVLLAILIILIRKLLYAKTGKVY